MVIEIGAPASLPLGLVLVNDGGARRRCLLGVTLQHPPVSLFAEKSAGVTISGARADFALVLARRFYEFHKLNPSAEIEIELAVPHLMGLHSDVALGLAVARALAWVHDLPMNDVGALAQAVGLAPEDALAVWSFAKGGLLAVDVEAEGAGALPPIRFRHHIEHRENTAWAFVFHFPKPPADAPDDFEAGRMRVLADAAKQWRGDSDTFHSALAPALRADDFESFVAAMARVQQDTEHALRQTQQSALLSNDDGDLLHFLRDNGARLAGRSLCGYGRWGLVRGAAASQQLRAKLQARVGISGGIVMAAVTDNIGARHATKDYRLRDNKTPPVRQG